MPTVENLEFEITDPTNKWVEVIGVEEPDVEDVIIPSSITIGGEEYKVTSIGDWAFQECDILTSITIPSSVTSIGEAAFAWCESLTSITIPSSVTSIGPKTCKNCSSLTSIEIPNSLTYIGDEAFYGCTNLKTVLNRSNLAFTKGVSNHGYIAFYADIVVNYYDGYIGDFIFSKYGSDYFLAAYAGNETELVLPENYNDSCYVLGASAFYGCSGLTSVVIPNSVTSIGSSAFSGCYRLTSVEIPNSVTSIGSSAFSGCI